LVEAAWARCCTTFPASGLPQTQVNDSGKFLIP
jgi:hypothetical protein